MDPAVDKRLSQMTTDIGKLVDQMKELKKGHASYAEACYAQPLDFGWLFFASFVVVAIYAWGVYLALTRWGAIRRDMQVFVIVAFLLRMPVLAILFIYFGSFKNRSARQCPSRNKDF